MITRQDIREAICWYTNREGGPRDTIVSLALQTGPLNVGAHDWHAEVDSMIAEGLLEQTFRSVSASTVLAPGMANKVTVQWLTLTPKAMGRKFPA